MSELATSLIKKAKEKGLTYLDLGNTGIIGQVPSSIWELNELEELVLSHLWYEWDGYSHVECRSNNIGTRNKISVFPPPNQAIVNGSNAEHGIGLKNLRKLVIAYNDIISIDVFKHFHKLEYLDLHYTLVSDISPLKNLRFLTTLGLSLTKLRSLENLSPLSNLKYLNLNHIPISDLNPLQCLFDLEYLNISETHVSDITPLAQLKKLEYLSLYQTKVSEISILRNHLKIKTLDLQNTSISDLSPLMQQVTMGLPITDSKRRKVGIFINMCPISNPPLEIARKGTNAILSYWSELSKMENYRLYEAKMMVVGEGGAGKTSLLRRLFGLGLLPEGMPTKGIDISPYLFITSQQKEFTLNIWDFSGQEDFHATHQLFFSKRALYVLVDDSRIDGVSVEDAAFKNWLEMIELLGGNSPVIIFQNKKGGRTKDLDQNGITKRHPNVYKRFFSGDLNEIDSVESIRQAIQSHSEKLEHVGELWPKGWVDLRDRLRLEAQTSPVISWAQYLELYNLYMGDDAESALDFSDYLHDLGVLLHYQGDKVLHELLILRNSWVTKAIYDLLEDEIIKANQGYFTESDCLRLWSAQEYKDKHSLLRQLMLKFEICYAISDCQHPKWLAPQLMTQNPMNEGFVPKPTDIIVQYHYRIMPKGIINRLMVRMNRHLKNPSLAWRNGVVFEGKNSAVLVEVPYDKKELHFRASGTNAGTLLAILADDLEAINNGFDGLRGNVDKMAPCKCSVCIINTTPHLYKYDVLRERLNYGKTSIECERLPFEAQDIKTLLEGVPNRSANASGTTKSSFDSSPPNQIRIFLSSSQELEFDRKDFETFINRENKHYIDQGVFLRLEIVEDFVDAMDARGLQKAYNQIAAESDLFVSLFHTHVGPNTREEFEEAFGAFESNGKPLIWTYFNESPAPHFQILEGAESILEFQDLLKRLGHYKSTYKNIDDLKHQFSNQLRRVLPELIKTKRH
jgi:GTPase SAR1 family protein